MIIVGAMPPELLGAGHKVGIRVDLLLRFPFLVGPETLEELLCRVVIVACTEQVRLIVWLIS